MQLMSDQTLVDQNTSGELPPPIGDTEKADKYINTLIDLITADKLTVSHTDLAKFDPTSLQDHYRMDLQDYEIEVSHNKDPDTGQDSFVMLFTNLKHLNEQSSPKVILAYIHLNEAQFQKFKTISDDQIFKKRKEAEEKRFKEAMIPIDQILEQLSEVQAEHTNSSAPVFAAS